MDDDGEALQKALLRKNLQKQLDEFQMLSAIFCNPGELQVDEYGCFENLNSFIAGETDRLDTKLDYRFELPLLPNEKVQILVELPHLYPALEIPRIVIRSAVIPRAQERTLTSRIERYIEEEVPERDEPYIYQVIGWIQDNFADLMLESTVEKKEPAQRIVTSATSGQSSKLVFERLWIYSHHLKSKAKRQTIIKTARDLELSGFSRPGKPAIICVEGHQCDTQEFWRTIKHLKWQKIQIKLCETEVVGSEKQMVDLRHFEGAFREELFCEMDEDSDTDDQPMSMSLFMKFLEKHNCGYIKRELFGFQSNTMDTPAS
uniref:RWD domain-containing protein n=1 Tax=Anopheles farauti TaxID=69004 RepID=A0A182QI58_9DIPT